MDVMPQVLGVAIPAIAVCFIAYLVFRHYNALSAERRARFEALTRMAERFSTPPELLAFLQSKDARELLRGPEAAPGKTILRFAQASVVLFFGGGAFLLNSLFVPRINDINFVHKRHDFVSTGSTLLLLGVGLLVVAFVTYRFARRWSVLGG